MAWAPTNGEVLTRTGVQVTDATITVAQSIIEDEIGRTEEAASGNTTAKDERILARAIGYQAAYLTLNPGIVNGLDVVSFSQPDYSATLRSGAGGTVLAPMAKRTLRHLPRVGVRSVAVESWTTDPDRQGADEDDATDQEWTPI